MRERKRRIKKLNAKKIYEDMNNARERRQVVSKREEQGKPRQKEGDIKQKSTTHMIATDESINRKRREKNKTRERDTAKQR